MVSQELSFHAQKMASELDRAAGRGVMVQVSEGAFKVWMYGDRDRASRFQVNRTAKAKTPVHSYGVGLELVRTGRWREIVTPQGQTIIIPAEGSERFIRSLSGKPQV